MRAEEHRSRLHVLVADDAILAPSSSGATGARARGLVLSDENIETAAGARWKSACGGTKVRSRVLPAAPRPVPSLELADALAAEVMGSPPDLLVAVGGGVISDLVKRVSLRAGVPSWCIVTAPSVDAFSSATAALRVAGYHQSVAARASEVIVCDLGVLRRAPRVLVLAGLGDLLAKLVANLDWNLAWLHRQPFCATVADPALKAARGVAAALSPDGSCGARSLIQAGCLWVRHAGHGRLAPGASAEHHRPFLGAASAARGGPTTCTASWSGPPRADPARLLELYRRLTEMEPDIEERLAACAGALGETLEEGCGRSRRIASRCADVARRRPARRPRSCRSGSASPPSPRRSSSSSEAIRPE